MRKVDDGKKEKRKKITLFLVATTSLPAVYRSNDAARTTTAGTPHARAKNKLSTCRFMVYYVSIGQKLLIHKLYLPILNRTKKLAGMSFAQLSPMFI